MHMTELDPYPMPEREDCLMRNGHCENCGKMAERAFALTLAQKTGRSPKSIEFLTNNSRVGSSVDEAAAETGLSLPECEERAWRIGIKTAMGSLRRSDDGENTVEKK